MGIQGLFPSPNLIEKFCQNQALTYLGVFGSYARGEAKTNSDVDILIDYQKPKSLFTLGGIVADLEKMIGKKVDLVKRTHIKPILKPYIYQDLITLYGQN
ncbi:MAG: nucleotidyltransferase family protein [Patescibacteria group bacterium]|nr:nucleotidyltransferase family protein [Patescibacteria group bacterium]